MTNPSSAPAAPGSLAALLPQAGLTPAEAARASGEAALAEDAAAQGAMASGSAANAPPSADGTSGAPVPVESPYVQERWELAEYATASALSDLPQTLWRSSSATGASENLIYGEGAALLSALPSAWTANAASQAGSLGLEEAALTGSALPAASGGSSYIADGLGSVASVLSGASVSAAYSYTPWGEASGAGELPFLGYNSQEHAGGGTGLQYLRARFYDAASAAFPTADSYLGDPSDPSTLNRYAYCGGNPVAFSDPSGNVRFSSTAQRTNWLNNYSSRAKQQKAKSASRAVSRAASKGAASGLSSASLVPGASALAKAAVKAQGQAALRAASARASLSAAASLLPGGVGKAVLGAASQAGKRKSASLAAPALSASPPGAVGYAQRQVAAVIERFCGSAPRMGSDSSGAVPKVHYTYDRRAAVEYARKYAFENQGMEIDEEAFWARLTGMGRNPMYPSYRYNCANFASQVVAAGGIPMTEKWHALREWEMLWESPSGVRQADRATWNVTYEWSIAVDQFNYFSDPANGFTNGVVEVYGGSGPKRSGTAVPVDKLTAGTTALGVKPGDLMYFYNDDGSVGHASVISSVTNNEIFYAGNSKRRFDESLADALDGGGFYGVYIVRMRDES